MHGGQSGCSEVRFVNYEELSKNSDNQFHVWVHEIIQRFSRYRALRSCFESCLYGSRFHCVSVTLFERTLSHINLKREKK